MPFRITQTIGQVDIQAALSGQGYTAARAAKLDSIDAAISSRAAPGDILANPANKIDGSKLDAAVSSRSTLTQAQILSDGQPFAGASIDAAISTRAAPGDILANASKVDGAKLDAAISSRAAPGEAMDLLAAAQDAIWNRPVPPMPAAGSFGERLKTSLDVNIGSRAAPGDILANVAEKVDGAKLDAAISSRADGSVYTPARAANLDNLNASVSSRAAPADILADPANKIDGSKIDAAISTRAQPGDILLNAANKVDGAKIDASISSRADGAVYTPARGANLDNLNAQISSRAAPGDILADPANKIDGLKIDAAVSSRSTLAQAQILSDGQPFAGASIDAAISSRAAEATAAAIKARTDNLPADPASQAATAGVAQAAAIQAQTDKLGGEPPLKGSFASYWQSGVGSSGEPGADLLTLGAPGLRRKVHSLLLDIGALTVGATIKVKLFTTINGASRRVYPPTAQSFVVGTDAPGVWVINGTLMIANGLRVEVQSDTPADDGKAIGYEADMEDM